MTQSVIATAAAAIWLLLAAVSPGSAQAPSPEPAGSASEPAGSASEPAEAEPAPALDWQAGPREIALADQAMLALPEGYLFLDAEQTKDALRRMGNSPSDATLGLVVSDVEEESWFVVLSYHDEGYIRDDYARSWDTDAMLKSMQEGTAEDNKRRREMGFPELILTGWAEKPRYDPATNKVTWAVANRTTDPGDTPGVNFRTLALGRYGYISMNLVTDLADLERRKPEVRLLLDRLNFVPGKRYADFNSATDKVAAVGLTALVAGTAAKLGLFGKLWAALLPVLLALKKLVVLAVVAIVVAIGKLFGRFGKRGAAAQ